MQKVFQLFQKQGFSLVELLVTISIVGLLTLMGMRSYRTQVLKARTAEAKHSLSFVYQAEKQFKDNWNTYHPSLIALGLGLSGIYNYDVGFGTSAKENPSDTVFNSSLDRYPNNNFLTQIKCKNFREMCDGSCRNAIGTAIATTTEEEKDKRIGKKPDCKVKHSTNCSGNDCISGGTPPAPINTKSKATQSEFKAMAITKLKTTDIWSIDQNKTIEHELDGIDGSESSPTPSTTPEGGG